MKNLKKEQIKDDLRTSIQVIDFVLFFDDWVKMKPKSKTYLKQNINSIKKNIEMI